MEQIKAQLIDWFFMLMLVFICWLFWWVLDDE